MGTPSAAAKQFAGMSAITDYAISTLDDYGRERRTLSATKHVGLRSY